MIQPIETVYQGYRFRSRLEARWAHLFTTLGLEWEYEKEGYKLPSGWYLPDFWLPQWRMWIEVKGGKPTDRELKLCEELATGMDRPVALVSGLPKQPYRSQPSQRFNLLFPGVLIGDISIFCGDIGDSSGGFSYFHEGYLAYDKDLNPCLCPGEYNNKTFCTPSCVDFDVDFIKASQDTFGPIPDSVLSVAKRVRFDRTSR